MRQMGKSFGNSAPRRKPTIPSTPTPLSRAAVSMAWGRPLRGAWCTRCPDSTARPERAAMGSMFSWLSRSTENDSAARCRALLEAHHEFGGVRAPVDGNHEGSRIGCVDFLQIVRDDDGHGDGEVLAEVAARVSRNRIGNLADQILDVLIAGVGLLHAHEQNREHAARRGKVHDAFAGAGNA